MSAMERAEKELFESTIVRLTENGDESTVATGLDEIGWHELLLAAPDVAVPVLLNQLGRHCYWSNAFEDAIRAQCLGDGFLNRPPGVVLARPGASIPARLEGKRISVNGVAFGDSVHGWLVPSVCDDGLVTLLVGASDLTVRPLQGLDRSLPLVAVNGATDRYGFVHNGGDNPDPWLRAEAVGRLALSHYIVGALRVVLDLARDHACGRQQFGSPVGSFQAIRHKLAECLVAISSAESAVTAAWHSSDFTFAAAASKLVTSRSAITVMTRAQQILAGIGFTAEHPFHHYLKRVVVLDGLLGSGEEMAILVGRRLLEDGIAPRLVEL